MVTFHNYFVLWQQMDNDYAFIHETNIVLDHMFYILGFILKSV